MNVRNLIVQKHICPYCESIYPRLHKTSRIECASNCKTDRRQFSREGEKSLKHCHHQYSQKYQDRWCQNSNGNIRSRKKDIVNLFCPGQLLGSGSTPERTSPRPLIITIMYTINVQYLHNKGSDCIINYDGSDTWINPSLTTMGV